MQIFFCFLYYASTQCVLLGKFIYGHRITDEISEVGLGININTLCGYGGKLTGHVVDVETGAMVNSFSISEDGRII